MMSFSKLLYPLQTLPLLIKHQDNATMNKAFKSFIWCNKKPRISLATLQRHKMEGGVGFPDIRLYNLASLMRHALDWLQGTSKFSVLKIEQELAKPWNLNALLHTKYSKLPSILKHSILLRDTIAAWKAVRKHYTLPTMISKKMTIWGHPEFSIPSYNKQFTTWQEQGIVNLKDLWNPMSKKLLTFQEMQEAYSIPSSHFLAYCQLKSFITQRIRDLKAEFDKNPFDSILGVGSTTNSLSHIYGSMREVDSKKGEIKIWKKVGKRHPNTRCS